MAPFGPFVKNSERGGPCRAPVRTIRRVTRIEPISLSSAGDRPLSWLDHRPLPDAPFVASKRAGSLRDRVVSTGSPASEQAVDVPPIEGRLSNDPHLNVLVGLIERLTGREVLLVYPSLFVGGRTAPTGPSPAATPAPVGASTVSEIVRAKAEVKTPDGGSRRVAVELTIAGESIGSAPLVVRIDPTVVPGTRRLRLDLGGPDDVADLRPTRIRRDREHRHVDRQL